jgi:hypothetical protein
MATSKTTTISIRLSHTMLQRIEQNAAREGIDRNSYILQWLPERHMPLDGHPDAGDTSRNTKTPVAA